MLFCLRAPRIDFATIRSSTSSFVARPSFASRSFSSCSLCISSSCFFPYVPEFHSMDAVQQPMPDFTAEDTFLLREGLMLAFGWDEERAIQHLEAT